MNNRQAGRRRGRGGQRQGGNPGRPETGNRIDNRARGNAAQLLEKYKNLARDAQMSGDRVNTEYYLQFADHYFRVLSETRSRFEETRRQREDAEDGDEEDYGYEGEFVSAAQPQAAERGDDDREPRRPREARERSDAPRGDERNGYPRRERERERHRDEAPREERLTPANDASGEDAPAEPRRRGRPRREATVAAEPEGFDVDRLPPALGVETAEASEERPRRGRPRRPRADDEAIPPAA